MEMECRNCQRSIKIGDGLKCSCCESPYHVQCADSAAELRPAGDARRHPWQCRTCTTPAALRDDALHSAVGSVNEKLELINKIQLPKLSNELAQLRSIADLIVKQNMEVLRKLKSRPAPAKARASPSPPPPPPSPVAARQARRGHAHATRTRRRNPLARLFNYVFSKREESVQDVRV